MAENEKSERDTHFLGFAEHVYEALAQNVLRTKHRRLSEIEAFKQEQHTIIAQFAYDLVTYALEEMNPISLQSYETTGEIIAKEIPDLTALPATSEEHQPPP